MGRIFEYVGLPGVRAYHDDASVVDECDHTGGPGDGMQACCDDNVGRRLTESCCMAGVEACELDEGSCGQVQQGRAASGGVCKNVLAGKRARDLPKHRRFLGCKFDLVCFTMSLSSVCCGKICRQVVNENLDIKSVA